MIPPRHCATPPPHDQRPSAHTRTFWRWFSRNVLDARGYYITPSNEPSPSHAEIIDRFWDDTFSELHGFDFRNA